MSTYVLYPKPLDLPGVEIGQTNANGFDTFLSAIDAWYSQSDRFVYGSSTNGAVSFFTQVCTLSYEDKNTSETLTGIEKQNMRGEIMIVKTFSLSI